MVRATYAIATELKVKELKVALATKLKFKIERRKKACKREREVTVTQHAILFLERCTSMHLAFALLLSRA